MLIVLLILMEMTERKIIYANPEKILPDIRGNSSFKIKIHQNNIFDGNKVFRLELHESVTNDPNIHINADHWQDFYHSTLIDMIDVDLVDSQPPVKQKKDCLI